MSYNEQRAEALRAAAYGLGDMLAEKAAAYGNAQDAQRGLWRVLLEPYYNDACPLLGPGDPAYVLPAALIDHLPRLTRVLDRVCRIVANPSGDRMGEDTWKDLAGDAVAGMVMPRTCSEPGCERHAGHTGEHGAFDARGVTRWEGLRREGQALREGVTVKVSRYSVEDVLGPPKEVPVRASVAMGDDYREDSFPDPPGLRCSVLHRSAGDLSGAVRKCALQKGHSGWHSGPIQVVLVTSDAGEL